MSDFSWGELHKRAQPIEKHARTKKHAEHDQKSHGSWAGGRGGGSMYSDQERVANEKKFKSVGEMSEMQGKFRRALNQEGGLYQQGERESIQRGIDVLQERIDANLLSPGRSGRSGISRIRPGAEGLDDLRQAASEARRALFTTPNMSESKRRAYAENVQSLERRIKEREKELREKS